MLRDEGLVLGALLLVRSVASYWQQAFLWEAAVNAAYWLRVYVFERVLERDLAFFEDGGAISAGDIAYRITAEAADVSDTMYAVLNVREFSLICCCGYNAQYIPVLVLNFV